MKAHFTGKRKFYSGNTTTRCANIRYESSESRGDSTSVAVEEAVGETSARKELSSPESVCSSWTSSSVAAETGPLEEEREVFSVEKAASFRNSSCMSCGEIKKERING